MGSVESVAFAGIFRPAWLDGPTTQCWLQNMGSNLDIAAGPSVIYQLCAPHVCKRAGFVSICVFFEGHAPRKLAKLVASGAIPGEEARL